MATATFSLAATARAQDQPRLNAAAQGQVDALQAEKASRTPAQHKLDSQLIFKAKKQRGERLGATLATMEARISLPKDGMELVDLQGEVTPELLAELQRLGAQIVASVPRFRAVRARVPITALETLAARKEVRFIKPAVQAMTHAGASTSQGDATHRSNTARTTLNATGRGLKVGVLSDSVDSLATSQALGDLGPVTVLPGQSGLNAGNNGEGTAMLEIVHDLAPDAELYFASAFISEAQFAQNILDLRAAGCDIIVDDVGYFDESPFQDGPVAQAVDQVVASGALYFSAAGNEGSVVNGTSGTWEGDFVDGGATSPLFAKAGRVHSFGAQTYNTITSNGAGATLFWSDPAGASQNDYDLYVLDSTGTVVLAASTNSQNGSQDPYESVGTAANTRLVVVKAPSAQPRHLHLNTLRGTLATSTVGTIQGHPAAAGAIAVAAVDANASFPGPFTTANEVEYFSTDGDRRFFFYADGTPATPGNFLASGGVVRPKPDMAAADGVTTSVPGFAPFYGTSAAAPHAAAIAAQVWSRNRSLTAAQVRTALTSTALDIETAGFDRLAGAGLLNALAATQSVAGAAIVQPGIITKTAESFTPVNAIVDPGETITVSLPLQNVGAVATTNLTATLLSTGGVSNPTTPAAYGALAVGASAARSFSFQANGSSGSSVTLTFLIRDGATDLGTATATFPVGLLGATQTFSNATAITIPSAGLATPTPSTINVSGVAAAVGKVTVTLNGFGHTYPSDVDILLVSPAGKRVLLLSDAGGEDPVTGLNLTFDDAAAGTAPTPLATGTYQPTVLGSLTDNLTSPAPAGPYAKSLSNFTGDTANGNWQLWVRDQFSGDSGTIASGWTLRITPIIPPATNGPNPDLSPVLRQSVTQLAVGDAVIYTATVYNNGPAAANGVVLTDVLPAGLTFANAQTTLGSVGNVGNTVTATIGALSSQQSAVVTITAVGATAGPAANNVSVALSGSENSTANNSASVSLTVGQPNLTPTQPAGWSGQVVISKVTGTNLEATSLTAADPIFLDLAYTNGGSAPAHSYFAAELYVDGVLRRTFAKQVALAPGEIERQMDVPLGTFSPGTHTVQLKLDALGQVIEANEADNVFSRTFTVQGANVTTFQPVGWSDRLVVSNVTGTTIDSPALNTSDSLFLDRALHNNDAVATSASFTTQLFVDGVLRTTWTTAAPFNAGAQDLVQDFALGSLTAGTHTLRLVTDAGGSITESNEADNEYVKTIVVNGLPTITDVSDATTSEDVPTAAMAFTIGDAETASASLSLSVSSSNLAVVPTDGIVLGGSGANRTITVTPAANRSGSSTITITVADGSGGQASDSFVLNVTPVNDPPTFTKGPSQTVAEDSGSQAIPGWASNISAGPADEALQTVEFVISSNSNPGLFSTAPAIAPDGTLTYTPAPDANGIATVMVTLHDNGGGTDTSAAQAFTITVSSINDAPTLDALAALTILENSAQQSISLTGIGSGSALENQTIDLTAVSTDPGLLTNLQVIYSAPSATAELRFAPGANLNGQAIITVTANDGGAENSTTSRSFEVIVTPVNNAPSFTKGADVPALQNEGARTVTGWATAISRGPSDEAAQSLEFIVTTDNPSLFAVAPAITPEGTLTFTPSADHSGSAVVTVKLHDSGGTDNGGVDTSAPQTFTISSTAVNDAPSFTKGGDVSAAQDAGPQVIPNWATKISAGPADESAQAVTFTVLADNPNLFAVPPAISPGGTLTFSPAPQGSGTAIVTVTLHDNGGSGSGNVDTSAAETFAISITSLAEETGTYNGLIQPTVDGPLENARAGLVKVTIGQGGAFTGRLTLLGKTTTVKGTFDNGGVARFGKTIAPAAVIKRKGEPDLLLTLRLDVSGGSNKLTGALTKAGASFAEIDADRALFTSKVPVAPFVNVPPILLGKYTVVFAARSPVDQGRPAAEFPQGDGVGTLTVSPSGVVKLVGTLADGSGISYSNALSQAKTWPLYVALAKGAGSISGPVMFRDAGLSQLDGQGLNWFKPPGAPPYPAGWSNGIKTDLLGSKYDGTGFSGLAATDLDGNARLTLTDGGLTAPGLTKFLNIDAAGKVGVVTEEADNLALKLKLSDGTLSGSFLPAGAAKAVKIKAVIFQAQGAAFGYFIKVPEAGRVTIVPSGI